MSRAEKIWAAAFVLLAAYIAVAAITTPGALGHCGTPYVYAVPAGQSPALLADCINGTKNYTPWVSTRAPHGSVKYYWGQRVPTLDAAAVTK